MYILVEYFFFLFSPKIQNRVTSLFIRLQEREKTKGKIETTHIETQLELWL